jgi:hypothetical protein
MSDVDTLMAEIRAVADDHVPADDYPADRYREALSATADHCGDDAAAELAGWIANLIEKSGRAPREPAVRSEARDLCEAGDTDPEADAWLAADAAEGSGGRA